MYIFGCQIRKSVGENEKEVQKPNPVIIHIKLNTSRHSIFEKRLYPQIHIPPFFWYDINCEGTSISVYTWGL